MATRDLHDQKILRALEGIEKQLKVQNGIFGDMSAGVNCNMKCKEKDGKIVTSNLRIFTNPDGSKTPIVPSVHVRYYVRFTTKSGGDVTNITNGKALWDSNNVEVLNSAIEIYFYIEG